MSITTPIRSNAVHEKLIEQCVSINSIQGYEIYPEEIYAEGADFADENNPPVPLNMNAVRDWKKRDCLARIMIYQTNDKERQKGINLLACDNFNTTN